MRPRDNYARYKCLPLVGGLALSYILFANPHSYVLFDLLLNYTCELLEFAVKSRLKYTGSMLSGLD
jgi:hypothetical protein